MKKIIINTLLCILSFGMLLAGPVSNVSALSLSGRIDKRLIQKVVRAHENEIRHCYDMALLKDKKLTGRIMTQFVILPDGKVERAAIVESESTLNNPEVEKCIIEHIEQWVFYSNDGYSKLLVNYPFEFLSDYKPPVNLEHTRVILNEDDMIVEYFDVPPS